MRTNLLLFGLALIAAGCAAPPGEPLARTGDEIAVCGTLFHIGTPVVLWTDPGGYDAYRVDYRYNAPPEGEPEAIKVRYGERTVDEATAAKVATEGWTLDALRNAVAQFVLHYDVAGTSRNCFKVLEKRGLSVHFMLDVDGTIYQTLDLKERAWHASQANSRSVGIEIAHIGVYTAPGHPSMRSFYATDERGPYVTFPKFIGDPAQRTPGFVGRPARLEIVEGTVHGQRYYQYDFTPEQYDALTKLCAALHRILPRIRLDAPRDAEGAVLTRVLSEDEQNVYEGLLGHFHVSAQKQDPGPAFDWERVIRGARALAD